MATATTGTSIFASHALGLDIQSGHIALVYQQDIKTTKLFCQIIFHYILHTFIVMNQISIFLLILSKIKGRSASAHAGEKNPDGSCLQVTFRQDFFQLVRSFLIDCDAHIIFSFYPKIRFNKKLYFRFYYYLYFISSDNLFQMIKFCYCSIYWH